MHQDRGLAGAQPSSSACSSTVDARHKFAIAVAGEMSQNMVTQAHEKWSMEIHQICGDVFGSGPKKTVQKLAAAGQDAEVTRLLEERARFLEGVSGLHAWHAFATDILGYSEPKWDVDVCKFLAIFRNSGTAANYVRYVKMGVHAPFHGDQLVVPDRHADAQGHARGAPACHWRPGAGGYSHFAACDCALITLEFCLAQKLRLHGNHCQDKKSSYT